MSNSQKTKSTVDHMIDTQGAIVDKAVEVTKKLSANVPMVNETLDKGQELFHKAVQSQKELTDKTTENINKINQNMNNSAEMAQNFLSSG